MLESIILGIVQGITEFFPISSTAHLVVLPWFMGWGGDLNTLTFDVALHGGTLVSLLICFRDDIRAMLGRKRRTLLLIAVGILPAGAAGVYLHDQVEGALRSPLIIAAMLVAFGLVMYASERFGKSRKIESLSVLDALFIGAAQALALVPGVSRSGATISAGLLRGMKRTEALRFSFLLSIPVIGGATLLEGVKLLKAPGDYDLRLFGLGFAVSMFSGILAIKFLLKYLQRHTLNVFVYYRFALAGVIAGWLWLGG
ncbi:MAG: undecaprenyl-diphosphate phosphatase [Thermodesulfovibrionales bacterium]